MTKNYLRIVCFIFLVFVKSVVAQESILPTVLIDEFIDANAVQNTVSDMDVKIKYAIDEDGFYEIEMIYQETPTKFKLKPLTYPSFQSKFKMYLRNLLESRKNMDGNNFTLKLLKDINTKKFKNLSVTEFAKIVTFFNTEEERPQVATIYLKDTINVYSSVRQETLNSTLIGVLKNATAEITFYDGFIEKVQIRGVVKNQAVTFSNKYSIGISSTKNIKKLSTVMLYSEDRFTKDIIYNSRIQIENILDDYLPDSYINDVTKQKEAFTKLLSKLLIEKYIESDEIKIEPLLLELKSKFEKNKKKEFKAALLKLYSEILRLESIKQQPKVVSLKINLSDVIRYVKKVDVNANDVSPKKQLVLLDSEAQKKTKLYKEESTRLFEAIVYTDFLSLFDEENPNGLVQTEVNKRFNINTRRKGLNKWAGIIPPFFPGLIIEGVGFFQYFDAQLQVSKIEKNNKFLEAETGMLLNENGIVVTSNPFFTPLSLLQHRNYAIGGILNIINMENQNAKLNMYFNAGFLFGRSGFVPVGVANNPDITEGVFVNNIEIPIEYKFHLLPEKRFSISLTDRLSWFENLDADIPLSSIEDQLVTSQNRWLNSFNIDLNLDTSSTGKLFLRYKLIHEFDNINNNFSQLQFGYSFYFLKSNGVKK
ncbi:hypothetical protein [Aquimarina sp. RZ0]|uniref:hypothetical protein n=1 Tax=Aquimarina sp. RZ0 TaxID=2607730 RepID=UPI0011F1FCC1|nr:hypothetical protein [Aquimarina sp. RZ0]KAA1245966.1 hypothetical protein F0000_09615 [Aquimarina sp. RZ0]